MRSRSFALACAGVLAFVAACQKESKVTYRTGRLPFVGAEAMTMYLKDAYQAMETYRTQAGEYPGAVADLNLETPKGATVKLDLPKTGGFTITVTDGVAKLRCDVFSPEVPVRSFGNAPHPVDPGCGRAR
ncbi:MAG TPA: hypothetical protein VJL28_14715 [Gemmatimonadaceae bacterium]|nr:hypothetical protein [Gemmatimonadaceae bacterium]